MNYVFVWKFEMNMGKENTDNMAPEASAELTALHQNIPVDK